MLTSDVSRLLLAIVAVTLGVNALIDPTEVYTGGFSVDNSSSDILLRIATGRAGQSSLVKGETLLVLSELSILNINYSPRRRIHPRRCKERLATF